MRNISIMMTLITISFLNANGVCSDLNDEYEHSLKLIAISSVTGITDDSAVRKTNRLLESNTEYLKLSIYISIMKENNCDIKNLKLGWQKYFSEALECETAKLTGSYDSPACDLTNWTGK